MAEQVAILNRVMRMSPIEKLTFEQRLEESDLFDSLWELLSKALSQELVYNVGEIARRPVE